MQWKLLLFHNNGNSTGFCWTSSRNVRFHARFYTRPIATAINAGCAATYLSFYILSRLCNPVRSPVFYTFLTSERIQRRKKKRQVRNSVSLENIYLLTILARIEFHIHIMQHACVPDWFDQWLDCYFSFLVIRGNVELWQKLYWEPCGVFSVEQVEHDSLWIIENKWDH